MMRSWQRMLNGPSAMTRTACDAVLDKSSGPRVCARARARACTMEHMNADDSYLVVLEEPRSSPMYTIAEMMSRKSTQKE